MLLRISAALLWRVSRGSSSRAAAKREGSIGLVGSAGMAGGGCAVDGGGLLFAGGGQVSIAMVISVLRSCL